MKSTLITSLIILIVACGQTKVSENNDGSTSIAKEEKNITKFTPDISINGQAFLHNPKSTINALGDIMQLIDIEKDLPDAYFVDNNKGLEYFRVVLFPGDELNSVSQFEIGYSSSLPDSVNLSTSNYSNFVTESGIELGMSKKEIIAIKGNGFTKKKIDNKIILKFTFDNFSTSDFLKKYNMPVYFTEYWLIDGKLVKCRFGFVYP